MPSRNLVMWVSEWVIIDAWCGEEVLCSVFPSLFNLTVQKDAMVAEMWDCNREEGGWSSTFLRPLNDWEMEEGFLLILHRQKISPLGEDKLLLKGTRD